MKVAINASRARSGGARAHLIGILSAGDPRRHGIRELHVWSYPDLLASLPSRPWLFRHSPPDLGRSLVRQVWWERFGLPEELRAHGCSILFNVDAGSVCRYRPAVTLSQDILAYEPREVRRLGFGRARVRQALLYHVQTRALRRADGVIFLTRYAADTIQRVTGPVRRVAQVPHGIDEAFRRSERRREWPGGDRSVRCLYVSPVWSFKNHETLVHAIAALRRRGLDVTLTLVGGGDPRAVRGLVGQIESIDPDRAFVRYVGPVEHHCLPDHLDAADMFVFASSCENMPVTLLEAMAAGLPIACSDRGPMPEILQNGGIYFDPSDVASVAGAIERVILDAVVRESIVRTARSLAAQYSWERCADETFAFVADTLRSNRPMAAPAGVA